MKIRIKEDGHNFTVVFPTCLVFSKATVWLANGVGRKYAPESLENIPPEALETLFAEFRRIKRQYGSWELVNIESADGEMVQVIL